MVRFRSAVCLVLTASVAAGLCTGCSRSKFTCSGDNLMGFEGYYYRAATALSISRRSMTR